MEELGSDVRLYAPLPGPKCSSTRTETAAILLALSRPGPVGIASDSLSAVTVMRGLLAGRPRKKPWGLHPNGDLWVHIARCVEMKGPDSISIKWVKGHSTQQHVRDGIITHADHLGNTIADQLADLGVRKHGDGLGELGCVYAKLRQSYSQVIHIIQMHPVEVFCFL